MGKSNRVTQKQLYETKIEGLENLVDVLQQHNFILEQLLLGRLPKGGDKNDQK